MAAIDTSLFPNANISIDTGEAMPVTSRLNALRDSQKADYDFQRQQEQDKLADQKAHVEDAIKIVSGYTNKADALTGLYEHYEKGNIDDSSFNQILGVLKKNPDWSTAQQQLLTPLMSVKDQIDFYEKQRQQQQFKDIMSGGLPPTSAAVTPAPVDQEQALFNQLNPSQQYDGANALAPTAAPAPSVNALDPNAVNKQITALYALGTPQAMAQAKYLESQLTSQTEAKAPKSPMGKLYSDLQDAINSGDKVKEQIIRGQIAKENYITPPAKTTQIVNTGETASTAFAKEFGGKAATELDALNAKAQSARSSLETSQALKPLLDNPNFISGTLGDIRLTVAKALGLSGADETQTFFAGMGRQVAENIKAFGSGTALSDSDRKYAEKIAGGSIDLTPTAIKEIMRLNDKYANLAIKNFNSRKKFLSAKNPAINDYYEDISAPDEVTRPSNVPSNWTLEIDASGNKAWVSPDRKQHVEVK